MTPDYSVTQGDLAGDRRRSLGDYAAQVTLVATFTGLCYLLATLGGTVMSLLPALFALMWRFTMHDQTSGGNCSRRSGENRR